jgi:crotonobetainyl-CoA:carnitine CoA-transferase CaiB-like acyl-CoA transferase
MGYPAYYTAYSGQPPARSGARHATIAPYGPFTLSDGRTVLIGIQNEREWTSFCASVLEHPQLAEDLRFCSNAERVKHRAQLEALIQERFRTMTLAQAIERLETAQIAYGQMRTVQEFLEHPQLEARERWREVNSPVGPLWSLLPPATLQGVEPVFGPIPELGQHTETILQELGYSTEQIAGLRTQGTI